MGPKRQIDWFETRELVEETRLLIFERFSSESMVAMYPLTADGCIVAGMLSGGLGSFFIVDDINDADIVVNDRNRENCDAHNGIHIDSNKPFFGLLDQEQSPSFFEFPWERYNEDDE